MESTAFIYDDVCVTPDRQIGRNSHPRWELTYVICGGGERTIGGQTESISEDEIILLPPEIIHEWKFDPDKTGSDGNIRNISVFFSTGVIDGMLRLYPEMNEVLTKIKMQKDAVFYSGNTRLRIKEILLSMRGLKPVDRLPLMIRLLIAASDMTEGKIVGNGNRLSRVEQRCEQIRVFCACNYARGITLEELSHHVRMNKSALCTFMRAHFGMTLSHYVNAVRLERAKEKLMDKDRNISEVAMDCGFSNVAYFNRLFKARYGCTPGAMRQSGLQV